MRTCLVISVLTLSGCATGSNSNVRWWSPGTWFSGAPAVAVDRAEAKEDKARHEVLKSAQRNAHETQVALASAPQSRPVEVATETNSATVALLDQAVGPLSAEDAARLRKTIAGLLSENAAVRAEAEKARAREQETSAQVSAKLLEAEAKSQDAGAKLRAAFEKENTLANELRNERMVKWGLVVLAVLLALGWLYVRFALGGFPVAIGKAMGELRLKNPQLAEQVKPFYTKYLNRNEQERIEQNAP